MYMLPQILYVLFSVVYKSMCFNVLVIVYNFNVSCPKFINICEIFLINIRKSTLFYSKGSLGTLLTIGSVIYIYLPKSR